MTQFSLYRVRHEDALVCRIQTDLGADTAYLLCAPVVRQSEWSTPIPMLHIPFEFNGEAYLILMSQMLALPTASLGPAVGFAGAVRDKIVRAVDLLVVGF